MGVGHYRIDFPAEGANVKATYVPIFTGFYTNGAPIKVTLGSSRSTNIEVYTSTDKTLTDGSFAFWIHNMSE